MIEPDVILPLAKSVADLLASKWPALAMLPEFAAVVDEIAGLVAVARDQIPVSVHAEVARDVIVVASAHDRHVEHLGLVDGLGYKER